MTKHGLALPWPVKRCGRWRAGRSRPGGAAGPGPSHRHGRASVGHDEDLPRRPSSGADGSEAPSMAMQSVLRSLLVLEAVAEHQPVRVGELTPLLGLPKSTIQRSLETLAEAGWLRPVDGDLTRWALTSRARSVVLRSGGEEDLRERALLPMQQLRDVAS